MKYIYACDGCDTEVNIEHSWKDEDPRYCEGCGEKMYRPIKSVSFILKGNSGARTHESQPNGWDWGSKRPNPSEGHKLSEEERRHIEKTAVEKQMKKWEDYTDDAQPLSKVAPKALEKIQDKPKKIIVKK